MIYWAMILCPLMAVNNVKEKPTALIFGVEVSHLKYGPFLCMNDGQCNGNISPNKVGNFQGKFSK
jgi:hypothetical protein